MAKLEAKHYEYLNKYLDELEPRLTYSNNRLEEDGITIDEFYVKRPKVLRDNIKVFKMILKKVNYIRELRHAYLNETNKKIKLEKGHELNANSKLTENFIIAIANIINKNAANRYLSKGYRTIDNNVKFDGKYPIEESKNIPKKMSELLNNYYGPWSELDVFEREARFHIEFLRIHPFDDGNGRTSRLLLNYNLLLQGHAPVLLPADIKKDYFDARNREDIEWIKELFEKESEKELQTLNSLIEDYEEENEREYLLWVK